VSSEGKGEEISRENGTINQGHHCKALLKAVLNVALMGSLRETLKGAAS
jgi:hypothetical protein